MAVLKELAEAMPRYYKPTTLQISEYLGLSKAGVNKCIHHLQSLGYIEYDGEVGSVILTPKLTSIIYE